MQTQANQHNHTTTRVVEIQKAKAAPHIHESPPGQQPSKRKILVSFHLLVAATTGCVPVAFCMVVSVAWRAETRVSRVGGRLDGEGKSLDGGGGGGGGVREHGCGRWCVCGGMGGMRREKKEGERIVLWIGFIEILGHDMLRWLRCWTNIPDGTRLVESIQQRYVDVGTRSLHCCCAQRPRNMVSTRGIVPGNKAQSTSNISVAVTTIDRNMIQHLNSTHPLQKTLPAGPATSKSYNEE